MIMGKWRFLLPVALINGLAVGEIQDAQVKKDDRLASYELQNLAKHALSALGADSDVTVYETDGISHAAGTFIRVNPSRDKMGPAEFITAHECGHIKGDHCYKEAPATKEASRALEKEADLFGAQALHDLGLDRAVFERIADLRLYAPYETPSSENTHPPLAENAEYLTQYMIDQGYKREYIDEFCQRTIPLRAKELQIDILA